MTYWGELPAGSLYTWECLFRGRHRGAGGEAILIMDYVEAIDPRSAKLSLWVKYDIVKNFTTKCYGGPATVLDDVTHKGIPADPPATLDWT